jgi:O-succinylbenzoic acid--CoA ligase
MSSYPFSTITINGKEVELGHILGGQADAASEFESSVFSFVKQWHSSDDTFIQKTSGSTGTPKLIVLTREQLVASAKLTEEALQLKTGDCALVCLDPSYIAGKMMLVRSFTIGMKIIATTPASNPLIEIPSAVKIDFAALVPYQLHEIIQTSQFTRLNKIKKLIVGGGALSQQDQEKLQRVSCQVFATYGMTETISHIALQAINGSEASPYFKVLPGIKVNQDQRGCLEIEAKYLGEKKIITNDLVEIRNKSFFKWLGRADNIINTGGIKVIPERVEAEVQKIFEKHKIKNRFLISSLPDAQLENKIVLLLEGKWTGYISFNTLQLELRNKLSNFEIPKELYDGISIVLTDNGKVRRAATRKLLMTGGKRSS